MQDKGSLEAHRHEQATVHEPRPQDKYFDYGPLHLLLPLGIREQHHLPVTASARAPVVT